MEKHSSFEIDPRSWRDAMADYVRLGEPLTHQDLTEAVQVLDEFDELLAGMANEIESKKKTAPDSYNRFEGLGKLLFRLNNNSDKFVIGEHESTPSPHLRAVRSPQFGLPKAV